MGRPGGVAGEGEPAATAPATTEQTSAALARASLEARFEEQQAKFDARLRELEDRAAGVWGGPAFAAAKALGADAMGAMNAGEAEIAIDRSRVALQRLERVAEAAAAAAEAQVDEGMRALSSGQTEVARRAFELALQIEPGNVRARAGIGRAGGLAPVLPTLADAEAALAAGEAARAAQLYRDVLRADPANTAAREGLARAEAASGDAQYSRLIGEALSSLREKRVEQARAALEQARALRPQGPEVLAGFRQLDSLVAGQGLEEGRRRGAELEAQERWAEALSQYDTLLARDPTLEFARTGKARAAPRAELAGRLQGLIDQPARLASPEVRREADVLLARARGIDKPGPVLRSQTTRLAELLPVYDTPVRVVLESDGATSVMIQRVGVLGSFARQEVDLKPGRYVAVGTRAGYRDVRREFLVAPGEPREAIQVRCVEPLQ
jgi:tetratricopeptide (TPR) repeat protein